MSGTRFFWSSIRWRAALLTSVLVVVVLATFIWYVVARVEADLIKRGGERAESATTVLAAQSAQTTQQGLTRINDIARDAAVRECLLAPSDATKRTAVAIIRRGSGPGQEMAIELWNASGQLVLSEAFPSAAASIMPPESAPAAAGLMPIEAREGVVFTRTVADVPADPAQRTPGHLGYLVISRVIRAAASSTVVNAVVGNAATVLIGNQSGTVWTDLTHAVPAPPIDLTKVGAREFRAANGEAQIGAPANIPGTPWVMLIAFPRSVVVAPAWQLLRRLVAVGVAFMLLAMLAAGALSGRVIKPLGELTLAAQAIERGDYSRRVIAYRRDEVGQLGHAFNAMAEQVESGRTALETRAEELAVSREAARHANRVKDEFLAVLSHELRTPLNAMLGWCQMLREGAVPIENTDRAIQVIERNALAQLRLVEDLLDVSRIVADKFVLEMQPVDPATVVRAAIESIQPVAAAKEIALTVDVAPEAAVGGGCVNGDPGRLQQVVWNLLSNAIKFTPRDGMVNVRVRHVGASVEIVVQDSGEGISQAALPFIFERLRQGESGLARRHSGLGLGLAIVRQVVDLHHGTVVAESDGIGHGAIFRIVLPISNVPAHRATHANKRQPPIVSTTFAASRGPSIRGLRILAVEDADDARDLLSEVLRGREALVTAVPSAEMALDWLARNHADVIISDIEMPGQDGFEMMRAIRSRPGSPHRFTPAIALTAYAAPEDRDRSLASGFQEHLIKPVNLTELLMTVARLAASPSPQAGVDRYPSPIKDNRADPVGA